MKKIFTLTAVLALCLGGAVKGSAEIPMSYYTSLDGKKGAELKTAIHNLVTSATMLSYGSGDKHTWWGFYVTDYKMDGTQRQVIDRYSNDVRYFGSRGSSVSGMNIEHSFPKSWWGGASNNAYKDLYNLMPCEAKINSSKSNYGMGVVVKATSDNGCTKVGDGADGYKLWEPADEWKGDFARGYMYMATAYQDFTWTGQALNSLEQGAYPTLKQWASDLYIQWADMDAVNQMEIDRNDAVSGIQGNRNPFIDFPNLMHYVWGDSINTPLNLATTLKAGQTTTGTGDQAVTLYNKNFASDGGDDCTTSGTAKVWTIDAKYGWKGTAYFSGACTEADASVETPEIDLTKYTSATVVIDHAANKFGDGKPQDYCSVEVRVDGGSPEVLTVPNWPAGTNWTFLSSGDIDLTPYCGHKVNIVLHYTSTTAVAGTWEIKTMVVTAKGMSGVEDIEIAEPDDLNAPIEYYSIDGRRLNPENMRGIVIRRQGHNVTKMIVR